MKVTENIISNISAKSLLLLSLWVLLIFPSTPQAIPGFAQGYVYGRAAVTNDEGILTWGEYNTDTGKYLGDIGLADESLNPAEWTVMSGDMYRNIIQQKQDLHSAQPDLELLSRADYQGNDILLASGDPMTKPPLSSTTAYVSILPRERRLIDDPQSLILAQYPVNPDTGVGDNIVSILYKYRGDGIGDIHRQSPHRISSKVAFAKDENGDPLPLEDNSILFADEFRRDEYKPAAPFNGVPLWSAREPGGGVSNEEGHFVALWVYPACLMYSMPYSNRLHATFYYRRFNPKQDTRIVPTYSEHRTIYDYCQAQTYLVPFFGPVPIGPGFINPSLYPISFIVDRSYLSGVAQLAKDSVVLNDRVILSGDQVTVADTTEFRADDPSDATTIANYYDLDRDGIVDTVVPGHFGADGCFVTEEPLTELGVWLSGNNNPHVCRPDLTRQLDRASFNDFSNQGLLSKISAEDLRNTDMYVVRLSDGKLIAERIGLYEYDIRQGGGRYGGAFGDDRDNSQFFYTMEMRGNQNEGKLKAEYLTFEEWSSLSGINPELHERESDLLQPGDALRIFAINRSSGYIGHVDTTYQIGTDVNTLLGGFIDPIIMGPPNLRIRVDRGYSTDQGSRASLVGFEGASLTSDNTVTVTTEWLDHEGRPIPESLQGAGYTGRIAILSGNQQLSSSNEGVYQFSIDPGRRLQVLQLPNAITDREHFYIHVSGEPQSGNPIFAGDTTNRRLREADFSSSGQNPGILAKRPDNYVPFLVPVFDEVATELQKQAANALQQSEPDPIYRWVFRPEMQFTSYDLQVDSIVVETDDNRDGIITADEVIDVLNDDTPIIDAWSTVDLLYDLTTTDLLPLEYFNAGEEKELIFKVGEQEVSATLDTNQEIVFDDLSHLRYLQPDDVLTIQLFANNDLGNTLWEFAFDQSIVWSPELVRKSKKIDLPNNWVCNNPAYLPFTLNEDALVSISLPNEDVAEDVFYPRGSHYIEMPDTPTGTHDYTITAVSQNDGRSQTRTGQYDVVVDIVNTISIGHAIEEEVDLYDGHLGFTVDEFDIKDRGPSLNFKRSYSSSNTQRGVLGLGWGHNYDAKVTNAGCGTFVVSTGSSGGKFFLQGDQSYRPEIGVHSKLVKDIANNAFDFYAKDGTHYHFKRYPFSNPQPGIPNIGGPGFKWYLEYVEDPDGNRKTLEYDETNIQTAYLTRVTDSSSRQMTFTYEELPRIIAGRFLQNNKVISTITAPDTTINFDYNDKGKLITVNNNGFEQTYTYEDVELEWLEEDKVKSPVMLSKTDRNGNETLYDYIIGNIAYTESGTQFEVKGAMYTQIDHPESDDTIIDIGSRADSAATELTATVTNPRGLSANYTLNSYGAPLRIQRANGTVEMTWNMVDVVMTSQTDERGVETVFQHDEFGNVTYEKVGDLPPIERTYTQVGNIVNLLDSQTDRNDNTTSFSYDAEGHLIGILHPDTTTESFDYFDNGDLQAATNRRGITTSYTYDIYGNVETETAPARGITRYTWDVRSLNTSMTDAEDRQTIYTYEERGLLINEDLPIGRRSFTYDDNGNKRTETDQLDRVNEWVYDGEDRVVEIIRPIGSKIMDYDGAGDLVRETDWNGNENLYGYNSVHHRTSETRPLGLTATITNDEIGNVLRIDWPEQHFVAYTYDDLSRRTSTSDPSGDIVMVLDGNGNKISETDQLFRETTFVYDSMDRLLETREPLDRDTFRTYDANGNLETLTDPNGNVTTNTYDQADRLLTSIKDFDETRYTYDLVGNETSKTDAEDRRTDYSYDSMNRRTSMTLETYSEGYTYDLAGNMIGKTTPVNTYTYVYDDLDRMLSESDVIGPVMAMTYDNNGNKLSETDANGNPTDYVYNALNFVINENRPEERNIVFTPDVFGNVLEKTDANNVLYSYDYDTLDRLISETHPNGTIYYTYDAVGNRTSMRDKRDNLTTLVYDDLNRLTRTTDPIGTTRLTYDNNGNTLTKTDRRDIVTSYTYDAWDRRLTMTRAGLLLETNTYDGVGNRETMIDANGNTTTYIYNHLDLVTEQQAPLTATTYFTYNDAGQRITMRDPENRETIYAPDARGRNLSETFQGLATQYTYDGNGNKTGKIRPGGNQWIYVYDGADRLTSVTSPTGTTSYEYDSNDNRLSQRDAGFNATSFSYDDNNLLTGITYPDTAASSYGYDANGNRTSATLPNGNSWIATFDAVNREITRSYNDGQSQANTYDNNNNLTAVTFNNGGSEATASFSFDKLDRQTSATDRFGNVITYQYDSNGNRTQVSSTGGTTIYIYDALNRVSTVNGTDGATAYSYDLSGLPIRVDYPSGISAITTYDPQSRVDTITNQQDATILSSYDYAYDANSNRTAQIEINGGAAETTNYTYDIEDRLIEVDYPDSVVSYTYDVNFNRLSEVEVRKSDTVTTKDKAMTYNSRNQLTNITDNLDPANNVTYSFDANGNQVEKVKGTETTTFVYNARDELRQVLVGGSTVGQFLYDHQGLRIEKSGDRGIERYTYDGESVLAQYDSSNTLQAHFQYGPRRLLNLKETDKDHEYYLFDTLGSPVNLTTGSGTVTARYQYDAWGNKRSETTTSFNRFAFTGHEEDTETGLIYAKARYYDPDTGRFLNQDPFEGLTDTPPSLHKYLYAYQNPAIYVDPDGRVVWFVPILAYVAYNAVTAAADTAVEAGIDAGVSAVTGQESEFDAVESYAINFGINLITGGTGGKVKTTAKVLKAADDIADHRKTVNAVDTVLDSRKLDKATDAVDDARQANVASKSKTETRLNVESSNGAGAKTRETDPANTYRDKNDRLRADKDHEQQTGSFVKEPDKRVKHELEPGDKPKGSPNIEKWKSKGGEVWKNEDGSVTYKDWDGNEVTYRDGAADFKDSGHMKKEVEIEDMQGDRYHDYKKANREAGYGEGHKDHPKDTSWHHKDCSTMQCVDTKIHDRFSHQGGVSELKNK